MSFFARSECGLFASRSVTAHLIRGTIAVVLIEWAILQWSSSPVFAVAAGVLAIVVMRGCPGCWMVGLFETMGQIGRARHPPGSCEEHQKKT